jgi:hypothetical protein
MATPRLLTEDEIESSIPIGAEPPIKVGGILEGTRKLKDPFTEGQKRDAGFALRMVRALKIIEELESSGFNPVNARDYAVDKGPFVPEIIEGIALSPKYKQYARAKIDFATAQLRRETGAVINASEIDWIDLTYFPLFGDDEITLEQKSDARRAAYVAMKTNAGKAYDVAIKNLQDYKEQNDATPNMTPEAATKELIERAKTNPALRQKLKERGIL